MKPAKPSSVEYGATWALVTCVSLMCARFLSPPQAALCILLTGAGLWASWAEEARFSYFRQLLVRIGSVAACLWLIYALVHSSFSYQEILLVWLKAGFLLIVVLSFNAGTTAVLSYVQALSIPLCMGSFWFNRAEASGAMLLFAGVIVAGVIVVRIRFLSLFVAATDLRRTLVRSIAAAVVVCVAALAVAAAMFVSVGMVQQRSGGIFPEGMGEGLPYEMSQLEEEYYRLKDILQEKATDFIFRQESVSQQRQLLGYLTALLNEGPILNEVERGMLGLISYLKQPGPGLKKGQGAQLEIILSRYLIAKAMLQTVRFSDEVMTDVRTHRAKLPQVIVLAFSLQRLRSAGTIGALSTAASDLSQRAETLVSVGAASPQLRTSVQELGEWEMFALYLRTLALFNRRIAALPDSQRREVESLAGDLFLNRTTAGVRSAAERFESLTKGAPELKKLKSLWEEILGLHLERLLVQLNSQLRRKMASGKVPGEVHEALASYLDTLGRLWQGKEDPAELQRQVNNHSRQLKESLEYGGDNQVVSPDEQKELLRDTARIHRAATAYLQEQGRAQAAGRAAAAATAAEKKRRQQGWLRSCVMAIAVAGAGLCVALLLQRSYRLSRKRAHLCSLRSSPAAFIVSLYENMRALLELFHVRQAASVTPWGYAGFLQQLFPELGGCLQRFTIRFEEAKYSQHTMPSEEAAAALADYTFLLRHVYQQKNFLSRMACRFKAWAGGIPLL